MDNLVFLLPLVLVTLVVSFIRIRHNRKELDKKKKELDQKIYETSIYREISEKIGYELNLEKVLETIVSSLSNFLSFSVVSYILVEDKKPIVFRAHLEEPVGKKFIDDLKEHMLGLWVQHGRATPESASVSDGVTGESLINQSQETPRSVWMIPLVINNQSVGILALASKKSGQFLNSEMEILTKILEQANRAVNNVEHILSTEKEKLTAMVASIIDGVIMLDKDQKIIIINPAAKDMLDIVNKPEIFISDLVSAFAPNFNLQQKITDSAIQSTVISVGDFTLRSKFVSVFLSNVQDRNRADVGTVILLRDLTTEKELERVRDEFTAMMVHELRAPLTVVRGATDMLIRNPDLATNDQGKELINTMQGSASSMLSLVNDLLDVSKIEAGRFQILKAKTNIVDLVHERENFFAQIAQAKSIVLSDDILDQELILNIDQERISQVFNNLISNAIKFTNNGGKVTISAYKINDLTDIKWRFTENLPIFEISPSILACVSDTGMGISSNQIGSLFTKFHQLHPSTDTHQGTGLGLFIAKGIIESHGGKILVQSKESVGTTFYFILPIGVDPD